MPRPAPPSPALAQQLRAHRASRVRRSPAWPEGPESVKYTLLVLTFFTFSMELTHCTCPIAVGMLRERSHSPFTFGSTATFMAILSMYCRVPVCRGEEWVDMPHKLKPIPLQRFID
ncbi:hypothetical protein JZ751_023329 [Albula glossodonta]|uniref:Uncharacterized protein n=1 Tax=Albula glossodonta TaxID=121402 RepID=A0A8T2NGG1_9TELE|nr:hypothetical protein JZ751_023329 [Albula glossodonta]